MSLYTFDEILIRPVDYCPKARHSLANWMMNWNDHSEEGFLQKLETDFLNPLGHVPVVGTLTGTLRLLLSIFDLFMALLKPILDFIDLAKKNRHVETYEMKELGAKSLVFFLNFIANFIRGALEIVPFGGKAVEYFWDANKMRMPCQ